MRPYLLHAFLTLIVFGVLVNNVNFLPFLLPKKQIQKEIYVLICLVNRSNTNCHGSIEAENYLCAYFFAFGLCKAQYAYFPNDLDLLAKLNVEQERIRYSEKAGDTSVFETNLYDINANLIEYKRKDNMPMQARIVFHFDETNFCNRVEYYRNFILYQYKEIKKIGRKQVERFYSVSGKYKGLEQNNSYDKDDREVKLIVKRKGHLKVIRKYTYHENGQIKSIWLKRDVKVNLSQFNEDGSGMGEKLQEIPRKVVFLMKALFLIFFIGIGD